MATTNSERDAVIVAAVRTAVGKAKKGSLADTRAEDLGRAVFRAAVERVPGLALRRCRGCHHWMRDARGRTRA